MTPADEVRAAVKVLREAAAPLISDADDSITPEWWRWFCREELPVTNEMAELLALMTPWVVEPLGDLLEHVADEYDREPCDGAPGVCNRCESQPAILLAELLAHAITGGTS